MGNKGSNRKKRPAIDSYMQQKTRAGVPKKMTELDRLKKKYKQLKAVHDLQNRTVRHFMHNIMSPLSAVSGYLELLANNLSREADPDKLERYSNRIGDGLNEIGFLLEQLHEIYKDEQSSGGSDGKPVVELNWLVGEVKNIVSNSTEIRSNKLTVRESKKPIYVEAELFQVKLMIYNLIITVDEFSAKSSTLEIELESEESEFALFIRCNGDANIDESLKRVFKSREIIRLTDDMEEDSPVLLGLKICAQIAVHMKGQIIMDKRDRTSPQFILSAPHAKSE